MRGHLVQLCCLCVAEQYPTQPRIVSHYHWPHIFADHNFRASAFRASAFRAFTFRATAFCAVPFGSWCWRRCCCCCCCCRVARSCLLLLYTRPARPDLKMNRSPSSNLIRPTLPHCPPYKIDNRHGTGVEPMALNNDDVRASTSGNYCGWKQCSKQGAYIKLIVDVYFNCREWVS